jgi:PmbA protein
MGRGLLVTELLGHGVNYVTGDYSRGAAGYWIEGGKIASPGRRESPSPAIFATCSGNIAGGRQRCPGAGIEAGRVSLLVEQMKIAGR